MLDRAVIRSNCERELQDRDSSDCEPREPIRYRRMDAFFIKKGKRSARACVSSLKNGPLPFSLSLSLSLSKVLAEEERGGYRLASCEEFVIWINGPRLSSTLYTVVKIEDTIVSISHRSTGRPSHLRRLWLS